MDPESIQSIVRGGFNCGSKYRLSIMDVPDEITDVAKVKYPPAEYICWHAEVDCRISDSPRFYIGTFTYNVLTDDSFGDPEYSRLLMSKYDDGYVPIIVTYLDDELIIFIERM